jgi:flagellar biosynthesis protein FliQ
LLQALTQIQEQSVSFVPKLIVMFLVLSVSLPWIISRMVHYTNEVIGGIPGRL